MLLQTREMLIRLYRLVFLIISHILICQTLHETSFIIKLSDTIFSEQKILLPYADRLKLVQSKKLLNAHTHKNMYHDAPHSGLDRVFLVTLRHQVPASIVKNWLEKLPGIVYVEFEMKIQTIKPLHMPNDPFSDTTLFRNILGNDSAGGAWYLKKINAYKAWEISKGDSNTVVAILDWGFDFSHEDLGNYKINIHDPVDGIDNDGNLYIDDFRGWDFGDNDNNPTEHPCYPGHGTKVAAMATATPNNSKGITGVGYYCKYLPIKLNQNGTCAVPDFINAFLYAIESGAKVINLSLDVGGYYQIVQDLINYAALDKNIVVVAAAGNSGSSHVVYPASHDNVLSVSCTDINDCKWFFGHHNYWIDVSVPIVHVYLPYLSGYAYESGSSSYAAPMVSGMAALIRSHRTDLNARQVMEIIRITARKIDFVNTICGSLSPGHFREKIGKGIPDLYAALTNYTTPAVRFAEANVQNLKNSDTNLLFLSLENLLYTTHSLSVSIRSLDPWVKVLDSTVNYGTLPDFSHKTNISSPFVISLSGGIPANHKALFRIGYSDPTKNYEDYEYVYITLNKPYAELNNHWLNVSIPDNGRIGYTSNDYLSGKGFSVSEFTQNTLLRESGIMISTGPSKVSDAVISVGGVLNERDFIALQKPTFIPSSRADRWVQSIFNDNGAGPNKIGVTVTLNGYAWTNPQKQAFVILEYHIQNNNPETIDSLFVGQFNQWNLPNLSQNHAYYRCKDQSGIVGTLSNGLIVANTLLNHQKANWFVMNNTSLHTTTGNINPLVEYTTLQKYSSIYGERLVDTARSGSGISSVLSTKFYNISPGKVISVAYAYSVSNSLSVLETIVGKAFETYRSFTAGPVGLPDTLYYCVNEGENLLRISATGGSNYAWYNTSVPCTLPIHKGTEFTVSGTTIPRVLWVQNIDAAVGSLLKKITLLRDSVFVSFTVPDTSVQGSSIRLQALMTPAGANISWSACNGFVSTSPDNFFSVSVPGLCMLTLTGFGKNSHCRSYSIQSLSISGAYVRFSDSTFTLTSLAQTLSGIVYANSSWTISGLPSWITVSPLTGTGSNSITFFVSENQGNNPRNALLQFLCNFCIPDTLKLIQSGQQPYIRSKGLVLANDGLRKYLEIETNTHWQILTDTRFLIQDTSLISKHQQCILCSNDTTICNSYLKSNQEGFIYIEPMSGTNSAQLYILYAENNRGDAVIESLKQISITGNGFTTLLGLSATMDANPTCQPSRGLHAQRNLIEVFPSPASDILYIQPPSHPGIKTIEVTVWDIYGHEIYANTFYGDKKMYTIDTSAWQVGMYFLRFAINYTSSVHKIQIRR